MRISKDKLTFLSQQIKPLLSNCKLYLFGSKVDDNKKGGDIDILILSERKLTLSEKLKIKRQFYNKYGEQKIDLVNFTFNEEDSFKSLILSEPNIEF